MASDQGPVVQSAILRGELVRLRKDRGLTQQQVAMALEWSPSKLLRIEGGGSSITKVDLDALLSKYGVTSESHRDRLQALNRGARGRGWWDKYRDDVALPYLNYVGYEAEAAFIRQYQVLFMPGLLQTAEYARIVTAVSSVDADKVESFVGLRLQRQAELARRSSPPRQYFVLDEGVIRRHVGIKKDRSIMADQLRKVADKAEQDDLVTVRVLPFEAGAHPGLEPFILLEFEGALSEVLYTDPGREGTSNLVPDDDMKVSEYAANFEDLLEDALSAGRSIELIRSVAEEMS